MVYLDGLLPADGYIGLKLRNIPATVHCKDTSATALS